MPNQPSNVSAAGRFVRRPQTPIARTIRRAIIVSVPVMAAGGIAGQYALLRWSSGEAAQRQVLDWARCGAAQLVGLAPGAFSEDAEIDADRLWEPDSQGAWCFRNWSQALAAQPGILATAVTDRNGRLLATWPPDADVSAWLAETTGQTGGCRIFREAEEVSIPPVTVASAAISRGPMLPPRVFVHVMAQPKVPPVVRSLPAAIVAGGVLVLAGLIVVVTDRYLQRRVLDRLAELSQTWKLMDNLALQQAVCSADLRTIEGDELDIINGSIRALCDGLQDANQRADHLERSIESAVRRATKKINTQLKAAEQRADIDGLTGLANRRFLEQQLESIVCRQLDRQRDLALVMFDVDNFKPLNDTEGHAAGDNILRFLGRLLNAALRENDLGIRYGGDEFLVILLDVDSRRAQAISERIIRIFAQGVRTMGINTPVTLSAGVACLEESPGADGAALLARTDRALYESKHGGKDKVTISASA